MLDKRPFYPAAGLVAGAVIWGLIWYPYRMLESAGLRGAAATCITYLVAIAFGALAFPKVWREMRAAPAMLTAIALVSGVTNASYVLGMVHGEVMRVLLLFYLAPLWTVPLARLLLGEAPTPLAYAVVGAAVLGAVIMLWRPGTGIPAPRSYAEWLGVVSGFGFALWSVLSRRLGERSVAVRSMVSWLGAAAIAGLVSLFEAPPATRGFGDASILWIVIGVGVLLFAANIVVQYGLTHVSAARAMVIFLLEVIVGALSSYWLAGEAMSPREWLGGALIVGASLLSGRLESRPRDGDRPG